MTTLVELKKYAKSLGFIERMKDIEFEGGPDGLWFYRLRGGFMNPNGSTSKDKYI